MTIAMNIWTSDEIFALANSALKNFEVIANRYEFVSPKI
jgi:hypothetical protein